MAGMDKLSGMTVHERLWALGLFSEWEGAAQRKDRDALIRLLGRVELTDQAELIADAMLKRNSV
jgi:hypothetical protein